MRLLCQFLGNGVKRRNFAAGSGGKKGGKGGKNAAAEEKPPEVVPDIRITEGQVLKGLDIFSKLPAPTIAKSYPEWVFSDIERIHGAKKSSSEILKAVEGDINRVNESAMYELRRALKRENTASIRMKNTQSKMK